MERQPFRSFPEFSYSSKQQRFSAGLSNLVPFSEPRSSSVRKLCKIFFCTPGPSPDLAKNPYNYTFPCWCSQNYQFEPVSCSSRPLPRAPTHIAFTSLSLFLFDLPACQGSQVPCSFLTLSVCGPIFFFHQSHHFLPGSFSILDRKIYLSISLITSFFPPPIGSFSARIASDR